MCCTKSMKWKQLCPNLLAVCTIFITPHKVFLIKSYHAIFNQNNFIGQGMHPPNTVTDTILSIHHPKRNEQQLYTNNNRKCNINLGDKKIYCMY